MELTGSIVHIGEIVQVTETFKKREFVVRTDEQYPQEILFQFSQDRVAFLHDVELNSTATVRFNIRGRASENDQGKRWFNTLDAWKITVQTSAAAPRQEPQTTTAAAVSTTISAVTGAAPTAEDDLPF